MMYNPDGRDPAFDQMVLLGHSMGGCSATSWRSPAATSSGGSTPTDRSTRSWVPRTCSTSCAGYSSSSPCRSSAGLCSWPRRTAAPTCRAASSAGSAPGLISDPDHIHKLLYQLVKDNPDAFDRRRFRRLPTSIETLEPNSPILKALLDMQPRDRALPTTRSSARCGPAESTDRPTASCLTAAPISTASTSEKVVRSDHGVQKDGEAIREVRRILREHVGLASETARAAREARYRAARHGHEPPQLPRSPSCCRPLPR